MGVVRTNELGDKGRTIQMNWLEEREDWELEPMEELRGWLLPNELGV